MKTQQVSAASACSCSAQGTARLAALQEKWTALFPDKHSMGFAGGVVSNPYCPQCRFCCGPQEETEPFPMALLDSQISARTKDDYYLLDEHTAALDQRGCRALGPCGCRLDNALRPFACNIFPYVLVNGRLYLYRVCPASLFAGEDELLELGRKVHAWLASLSAADVERISITRSDQDLADKYLDLGLAPLC